MPQHSQCAMDERLQLIKIRIEDNPIAQISASTQWTSTPTTPKVKRTFDSICDREGDDSNDSKSPRRSPPVDQKPSS